MSKHIFLIVALSVVLVASRASAFVPGAGRSRRPTSSITTRMALMTENIQAPPPVVSTTNPISTTTSTNFATVNTLKAPSASPLNDGINQYLSSSSSSSTSSSTMTLSLQERRAPTKEEIAAKKRNFNLWFWGGGFVAPFLATFYYFGLKFWEK